MKNRDIYKQDPGKISLLNQGVASMTDALTDDERRTLRFELKHFVCEGEYQRGLVRILQTYIDNQGQPEQPAAWVSGFFGSGKSHLAKMLRFLWIDYTFPEDDASARGLPHLPTEVKDLLVELTTLGKRTGGLHAAAGTLGAGAGSSVRLALLGMVFKSADLPEGYPQARFCLWLKANDIYEQVRSAVEAEGRDFENELSHLYASPRIAQALLAADPNFANDEKDARATLRAQFPKPDDITTGEFVTMLGDTLSRAGEMPNTVIILDEVQQYIGEDASRSYVVQEVVEACSKKFGDRLLFLGTGQTALAGSTPALQRLQGRFTVNIELSDTDVETVTRRVVLAKRPDRLDDIRKVLDSNAGELDRHLNGTGIQPRSEDKSILVEDYPLLPVRRRFWEHALRAVDRAGTAAQLRTQLRMVYDAIDYTADKPVGTVVPADYLFEEQKASLLQSGVLLREINDIIASLDDGTPEGKLKSRACSLIFLIRKLPRESGVDIGVRATAETLADLMVEDLAGDGASIRGKLPELLDELFRAGTLMKLRDEYSLQTREGSEWEAEFRDRESGLRNDPTQMSSKRAHLLRKEVQETIGPLKLSQGEYKEPRNLALYFGVESPPDNTRDIPVWIRDGWGEDVKSVVGDARAAGPDSPVIHLFIPKTQSDALARAIAAESAAQDTLDSKGAPSTPEGSEARQGMETRLREAAKQLRDLLIEVLDHAEVYQGGGHQRPEMLLREKIEAGAHASFTRLFPEFRDADADASGWRKVIERARNGDEHPLEELGYDGRTEDHPVCSAVLSQVGSGKKGKSIRDHFSEPPYGWPRDAIDAALISLFGGGHLRATINGVEVKPKQLDQGKVSTTDFRVESATIHTPQRLKLRKLFTEAGVPCKPNEESEAAGQFLARLQDLAQGAGGEAPLPDLPDTSHLASLQSLAGNEQLLGILDRHDELLRNFQDWTKAQTLAQHRLPAYQRLQSLARHAEGLEVYEEVQPQIEAIAAGRILLDDPDTVPDITQTLVDALRRALGKAEEHYSEAFNRESAHLEEADSWQKIKQSERDEILKGQGIVEVSKGPIGTTEEVLESLERVPLEGWRTRAAALPQLFAEARTKADWLVEPETQHVRLGGATLRTPDEVKAWVSKTERELLEKIKQGPVVVE